MTNYKLSVRLMTYNHEKFIKNAIDGILMQKTNFNIEVVIGDDFSTDNTLNLIRQYQSTDNIHLKILKREVGDEYWKVRQQKGRLYNFSNIVDNCSGKYIAWLDGDDYWTDPLKLQKQVDFLEANPDYSLCFHRVYMDWGKSQTPFPKNELQKDSFSTVDLFEDWFIPTSSVVFKRPNDFKFPEWFFHTSHGDLSLLLLMSLVGNLKYINQYMGVYRMHDSGLSNRMSTIGMLATISFVYANIARDSNFKVIDLAKEGLVKLATMQVERAVSLRTENLATDIIRNVDFISKKVSAMDLVRAIMLKISKRLRRS